MAIKLYMDVHVRSAITVGLRQREIDVLTAQEDHTTRLSDPKLLDRATELERTLFTADKDLLIEANRRQKSGKRFAGVIYIHQQEMIIGQCVDDLELMAKIYDPEKMENVVEYLPLK